MRAKIRNYVLPPYEDFNLKELEELPVVRVDVGEFPLQ